MIPPEVRAEIRRLREVEGLRVNTIARLVGVHHSTVSAVIERVHRPTSSPPEVKRRPSILDPYMPLIIETLKKYPTLPANQLYEMLRRRERHTTPPVAIDLPDNPKVKNLTVVPHELSNYDPEDDS